MILRDKTELPEELLANPIYCRSFAPGDTDAASCAHQSGEMVTSLLVRRAVCAVSAALLLYSDAEGKETEYAAEFFGLSGDYDEYRAALSLPAGLYYYTFRVKTESGVSYIHSVGDERRGELREEYGKCGKFQLLLRDGFACTSFSGSAMYHVFVDRFRVGGRLYKKPRAVYNEDWNNGIPEYGENPGDIFPNNTHFGGNLYGVCEKLDYIKSLGCDIIYLSPVFEAYSNHKYDTGDYEKIDPGFGGLKAFHKLACEAHRRGMKLVLDGVFNHTGSDSVYFNKEKTYPDAGAYNSKHSKYYPWFYFRDYPEDYECWWGVKTLPKLNGNRRSAEEFFCGKDGIVRRWLRQGADGWRLDVADELPDEFLSRVKASASEENPESVVIGEVWEDASNKLAYGSRRHYFSCCQLDSVMNYPLRDAIIEYTKTGCAENFASAVNVLLMHYPTDVLNNLMNFLGSHDTERIITVLGGAPAGDRGGTELSTLTMSADEYENGKKLMKFAFTLLCAMPGIPCVYYGDEAGMQGYRDPFNRRPFPWGREDAELTNFYADTLNSRKNASPLCRGDAVIEYAEGGILIIRREYNLQKIWCVFNAGKAREISCAYTDDIILLNSYDYIFIKEQQPDDQTNAARS